jgi:hypothetical protein
MIHDMIMAAAGVSTGAASDANFENTVLLLHGDGTNGAQNNTFIDSSTNNFTITRNGNTTQGTFSPFSKPDGRWGNWFNNPGADSYAPNNSLSVPYNSALVFGTGDFTVECWFYLTGDAPQSDPTLGASNRHAMLVNCSGDLNDGVGSRPGWIFFVRGDSSTTGTAIQFINRVNSTTTYSVTGTTTVDKNKWNHAAVVRSGTTTTVYLNGVAINSGTLGDQNISSSMPLMIGEFNFYQGLAYPFPGFISNLRIVKGTAVYTTGFTPPTTPLTAITNTSLLTCQSNAFKDNSSNNFSVTPTGTPKVTPFSPFPITTAYSTSVNGGAGYFDGSGDYLTAPSSQSFNLSSGNWTIEGWTYGVVLANDNRLFSLEGSSTSYALIRPSADTTALQWNRVGTGALITSSSGVSPAGSWTHFALVSNSGTITLYVNGVSAGTTTTYPDNSATQFTIAATAVRFQTSNTNAYLSDIRVVKGTAVYTTGFTPPTAPPTAITNTSLLCNFTNAGIFDNTGFNALETVGNAQIDTTTKKYGTGSMEFDGTGDWLIVPDSPDLKLGTGNFTIEFWVYLASGDTGSNRGLVAKGGASTGWLVSLNTTQKVVFTYTTSTITSSGAITTNAWNHIAVVREGTGSNQTKIYIGGTNDGTGTVSTDFTQTEVMYIGANRAAGDPMKGFIDDLRITKGIARYTSNFTAPTKAFEDIGA